MPTTADIPGMITLHALWLTNSAGGARALFDGSDLKGYNFNGQDLRGASFRNCQLVGATFQNARLDGVDFTGAKMVNVDMTNALAPNANMDAANLFGATLPPDTSSINMDDAELSLSQIAGGGG